MNTWATPILHADVDAFYASVEVLRDPSLKGKPVIVGGTSSRGVVTSASYEARRFGVASAMPTSRARRLCPHAIFIQPDFDIYGDYSRRVREVFDSFSPVVEPLSLDEAFLDIGAARRMWDGPESIARMLRSRVKGETGLVVSVGLAPNKFLAKLASSKAKPDGVLLVEPHTVDSFLGPLPISDLWGVGQETASMLRRLGLRTVGDVTSVPVPILVRALGSLGEHIARLAAGRDDRPVIPDAPRKSLGAEETFERDLVDSGEISHALLSLSDRVASRLRGQRISGRTVTLKVRYSNFTTVTRSRTLKHETDSALDIYGVARNLLPPEAAGGRKRVRLLGVSLSNLSDWPASEQLSLEPQPRWGGALNVIDGVRRKFGEDSLRYGSLLEHF